MAYKDPTDGGIPMYGGLLYISKTANSITIRIPADSVSSATKNLPILLQLNPNTIGDGTTFESIFTELAGAWNKLYVTKGSYSQVLYTDSWDDDLDFARVWVVIDELTTGQTDLVIEFDSAFLANPLNDFISVNAEYDLPGPLPPPDGFYDYAISLDPDYYYRLGETVGATIAVDDMGNADGSYELTPILGQQSLINSDYNPSVNFNEAGFVDVTSVTELIDNTKPFSLVFSTKLNVASSNDGYFSLPGVFGQNGLVVWAGDTGYGNLALGNAGTSWASVHTTYTRVQDQIYQIVITYEGNSPLSINSYKFYIDGVQHTTVASGAYSTVLTPNLEIGNMTGIAGRLLPAFMDEVMIFTNRSLTQQDISNLYTRSMAAPPPQNYKEKINSYSPKVYYRLGEAVAQTVAVDESGNSNDGNYIGSDYVLGVASMLPTDPSNTSVYLANNGEVDFDSRGAMVTTDAPWSISCVVRFYNSNTQRTLCELRSNGASGIVIHQTGHKIYFGSDDAQSVFKGWVTSNVITSRSVPAHLLITYNGVNPLDINSYKLYHNGVSEPLVASTPWGKGSNLYNRLGAFYHTGYGSWNITSQCYLDEYAIIPSELSQQDSIEIYNFATVV